jgi:DNA-binding NarL/FixJ family response regulator
MRFLIVDDHPFIRKGLIHELQNEMPDGSFIADEAECFDDAMEQIRVHEYDLVTVDISLKGKNGILLLKQIKEEQPHVPVLIISTYSEDQYALETIKLGAAGYISKHSAANELMSAISQIKNTEKYISPAVALLLAEAITMQSPRPVSPNKELSKREMEVASMLVEGKQLKTIAFDLGLSVKTVSTHRTRLLNKLDLGSNVALANYFSQHHPS